MKKIINKGYTLTVVSWENDGDNYRTKSMTVDTKEQAQAIHKMCTTLFLSRNKGGIGNLMSDDYSEAEELIVPFMKNNLCLLEKYDVPYDADNKTLINICNEYNYALMGGSECYYSRVCESCTVTYSPEDIFLEEITF